MHVLLRKTEKRAHGADSFVEIQSREQMELEGPRLSVGVGQEVGTRWIAARRRYWMGIKVK